jgi:hypothetical protein
MVVIGTTMFFVIGKVSCLAVVAVLFLTCGKSAATEDASWTTLQLRTSGGFTGRGNGNLLISSDGHVAVEDPVLPGKTAKSCEGRLSAEQLRKLNEVISQIRPNGWNLGGLNAAAPDAFHYHLELTSGAKGKEKIHEADWYDNTRNLLPGDLNSLAEFVWQVKASVSEKCRIRGELRDSQ